WRSSWPPTTGSRVCGHDFGPRARGRKREATEQLRRSRPKRGFLAWDRPDQKCREGAAVSDTKKSPRSSTAKSKTYEGFTDEERAAMKDRAKALKGTTRRGSRATEADAEGEVLAKIAEMGEPDRQIGERLHAIIRASAPALSPRLWYGMPAYGMNGNVV